MLVPGVLRRLLELLTMQTKLIAKGILAHQILEVKRKNHFTITRAIRD